jgi:sodium-dependent phosphate cotransporter
MSNTLTFKGQSTLFFIVLIFGVFYSLISAVWSIGSGFSSLAGGRSEDLFAFAKHPVVGLVCGILVTALVQSSSTVSASVVALVGGGLPINIAIPIIMGSNIGTSLSSTLVSLGHVKNKSDFSRAFAAATVHDSFNLLAVLIFFPIEYATGFLGKTTQWLSSISSNTSQIDYLSFNPLGILLAPIKSLSHLFTTTFPDLFAGIILIVGGLLLLFGSIKLLTFLLKGRYQDTFKTWMQGSMGRGPVYGIGTGGLVTILLQSSSVTTSLIIPLAGKGLVSLRQVYPYTLGTNIGTTFTGLLAAMAVVGTQSQLAFQIALVHLCFNIFAVLLIYPIPILREIPIKTSLFLAQLCQKNKWFVVYYIVILFFVIPTMIIIISKMMGVG